MASLHFALLGMGEGGGCQQGGAGRYSCESKLEFRKRNKAAVFLNAAHNTCSVAMNDEKVFSRDEYDAKSSFPLFPTKHQERDDAWGRMRGYFPLPAGEEPATRALPVPSITCTINICPRGLTEGDNPNRQYSFRSAFDLTLNTFKKLN
jgi:hypothetical protein